MNEHYEAAKAVGTLALVGLVVGLGQLLASTEKLTFRIVIGRALSSAGIGASSAAFLALIPNLPYVAQLGMAAALASLGTSALERIIQRLLSK